MTALTAVQTEVLRLLDEALDAGGAGARIRYRTEWLGYLPYGQYHWVDVDGAGELRLPDGWAMDDLLALERAGHLRRVSETREPASDMVEIVYERRARR